MGLGSRELGLGFGFEIQVLRVRGNLPVDEKLVAPPLEAISALRQQFAHLVALPPVHLRV